MDFPKALQKLIHNFNRLPGIGPKTAERLAFFMLKQNDDDINSFSNALANLKDGLKICNTCFNVDEFDPCKICSNSNRDSSAICVIETPLDLIAIEKSRHFLGLYHVLNGVLSPIDGIGPNQLTIQKLLERIEKEKPEELIMALNPSMEAEATSAYIRNQLEGMKIKIKMTRIAQGLPTGSNIEYADNTTLKNALNGRVEINN